MTADDLIVRARSVIGQGCVYKLGMGGRLWHRKTPWHPGTLECDCSGFIAWVGGVDRHTDNPWYVKQNGGWLETSAIVRDAKEQGLGMFDQVPWEQARPGMLVVYGDHDGKQGHVGLVSGVNDDGPLHVVHCSAGNTRAFKDAIQETSAGLWQLHGGIVARWALAE